MTKRESCHAWSVVGVFLLVGALFTVVPFLVGLATGRKPLAVGLAAVWAVVAVVSQASDDELPTLAFGVALLGVVGVFCAWIGASLRQNA
jgi:hypothetical protein